MENKLTAVEWLVEEMILRLAIRIENVTDGVELFEQAKAMEKEQIKDAYCKGVNDFYFHSEGDKIDWETYFKETYGKNESIN